MEKGLAEAEWYTTPVTKAEMRKLLERRNGLAIRDMALLFLLLRVTGYASFALWGTWWVVIPYLIYAVLCGTSSDSRWHEFGHVLFTRHNREFRKLRFAARFRASNQCGRCPDCRITAYASTDPEEDFCETMAEFLKRGGRIPRSSCRVFRDK